MIIKSKIFTSDYCKHIYFNWITQISLLALVKVLSNDQRKVTLTNLLISEKNIVHCIIFLIVGFS